VPIWLGRPYNPRPLLAVTRSSNLAWTTLEPVAKLGIHIAPAIVCIDDIVMAHVAETEATCQTLPYCFGKGHAAAVQCMCVAHTGDSGRTLEQATAKPTGYNTESAKHVVTAKHTFYGYGLR